MFLARPSKGRLTVVSWYCIPHSCAPRYGSGIVRSTPSSAAPVSGRFLCNCLFPEVERESRKWRIASNDLVLDIQDAVQRLRHRSVKSVPALFPGTFFPKIIRCRVCSKRVSCKGGLIYGRSGERHVCNFFVCLNLGLYVKKRESEEFKLKVKITRNLN